jgi:ComF family protein
MISWVDRLRRQAARWGGEGVDLLFPPRCAWCHRDLEAAAAFCPACARELAADCQRCLRCGEPGGDGEGCSRCRGRRVEWQGIAVLGGYGDSLRDAILRAKHPGGDDLSRALGRLLVDKHRETFAAWNLDGVVPVPMHWLRRAARGTSAAHELARAVARLLGLPLLVAVSRHKATRMQNELPVQERRGNVQDAFRPRQRVEGRRLLLVDDVITTGATLAACGSTLVAAGAEAVFVSAIARADREPEAHS